MTKHTEASADNLFITLDPNQRALLVCLVELLILEEPDLKSALANLLDIFRDYPDPDSMENTPHE